MFKSNPPLLQEFRIQKFPNFSEQNENTDQIQLQECGTPSSIVERITSPPLMIIPTPIHHGMQLNSNFIIEKSCRIQNSDISLIFIFRT